MYIDLIYYLLLYTVTYKSKLLLKQRLHLIYIVYMFSYIYIIAFKKCYAFLEQLAHHFSFSLAYRHHAL